MGVVGTDQRVRGTRGRRLLNVQPDRCSHQTLIDICMKSLASLSIRVRVRVRGRVSVSGSVGFLGSGLGSLIVFILEVYFTRPPNVCLPKLSLAQLVIDISSSNNSNNRVIIVHIGVHPRHLIHTIHYKTLHLMIVP